jgi:hypothetical protein
MRLVEMLLSNLLQDVVDVESHEPALWPKSSAQQIPLRFTVLTPTMQRTLDQSA